ncbi:MAG: sigma-54-dependent Fis family transcriptional regulator, partial [Deltaproteobacteria bacterium]|nr:sigma 54-interacting transcriptional regulator [Candidatus Deferrimicrobiaceae bacterium]
EQHSEIVELFQFYTKRFTGMLEQVGACSFVCDSTGYVLSRVGSGKILNYCDDVSIREGANCSESSIGTNAPGLALITREPVIVTADEHYSTTYHPAFCVASPILDENRNLLGCVDITKFFDRYISEDMKKHLLNLAISLSDMIRNEVFLGKIIRSSPILHNGLGSIGAGRMRPLAPPVREMPPSSVASATPAGDQVTFSDILGSSPLLSKTLRIAQCYSQKEGNILIQGETGTGKEMLARAIHSSSGRSAGPFVAVNCAAIPVDLAESELFGYERGAFTGAKAEGHPGKFETAHGGTLFLDEINSMPLTVQAKILRAVETKRISRINGKHEVHIDVRIITASNKCLSDEVTKGDFRKDLYFRLNVLRLMVPSLREIREDIPRLMDAFLSTFAREFGAPVKTVSFGAKRKLLSHDWPGNIRELKNCVEFLYHTVDEDTILESHLPPEISGRCPMEPCPEATSGKPTESIRGFASIEREFLAETMCKFHGNALEAAKALGISRSTLYRKLKKHGGSP